MLQPASHTLIAAALHADAVTCGDDIFFRGGCYRPESTEGFKLLSHEAAHVLQQRRGWVGDTTLPRGVRLGSPADPWEREAD